MFDHCIQNGQEFTHTSDQGHLGTLTGCSQSFVKSVNGRIVSARYQGSHIKTGPYRGAPAPDAAAAFKLPLSRLIGAISTRDAICLRLSFPSSGSSAINVRLTVGPIAGAL